MQISAAQPPLAVCFVRLTPQGVNGSCESGVLLYRAELKMSIYGMFLVGAEDLGDDGGVCYCMTERSLRKHV